MGLNGGSTMGPGKGGYRPPKSWLGGREKGDGREGEGRGGEGKKGGAMPPNILA